MINYLVYLQSIGFSQKHLSTFFENNNNYKEFFDNLSFETLSKYNIKDEKVFEIMANYKIIDYTKINKILAEKNINIITVAGKK